MNPILIAELIARVNSDVARLIPLVQMARALREAFPTANLPELADSLDRSDVVGDRINRDVRQWFKERGRPLPT